MMENKRGDPSETTFLLENQTLVIDALRALFWKEERTLILSDLHLGKAGHFRKNGIPIPKQVHASDLDRLNLLIRKYQPQAIIFLGDLFHSEHNDEWEDFIYWSAQNRSLRLVLIKGNHDVLCPETYEKTGMEILSDLVMGPFHFSHEPSPSAYYNLAGHIHPGVKLQGRARQGVKLPCFLFSKKSGLFPAFGSFTGNNPITPSKGDHVFAITDCSVIGLVA